MGAKISKDVLLHKAVQSGNRDAVNAFHQHGASLEWMDKTGRTPLILACTRPQLFDMAITLINLGANVNSYKPGPNGGTPLHHAAIRGLAKTITFLLSRGANPFAINDDCQTPLGLARARNHASVVRIIEGWISFFSGIIWEHSVLEFSLLQEKIWVVVLPSHNPRGPPTLELVIYSTPEACQPRTIISLSNVEIEEPNFSLPDPVLVLFDKSTNNRYMFLSEFDGGKQQLQRLYEACRGIPQNKVTNHYLQNTNQHATIPLLEDNTELAKATAASVQSASQGGIPLPPSYHPLEIPTNDPTPEPSLAAITVSLPVSIASILRLLEEHGISCDDGSTVYPSINDSSPIEDNLSITYQNGTEFSASSSRAKGNTEDTCVICGKSMCNLWLSCRLPGLTEYDEGREWG